MNDPGQFEVRGRGSHINPTNRFVRIDYEDDPEYLEHLHVLAESRPARPTEYFVDQSRSIISENDSPDIPFRYSLNPYRGCAHGCSYCFARPSHEYLDLSAGLDFETKIFVKERAADLFRDWLTRPGYRPEVVMFSGVTDCYQPAERHFQLTRRCLEVALEARQPIAIVTKNALVSRDLDLLKALAGLNLCRVSISLTTLDQGLVQVMEPRCSCPAARLRTISELSSAGVPTNVMVAPIIPGLNDAEMPAVLEAASQAGAQTAAYVLLRLPLTVEPVFFEWLERTFPEKRSKIESRIRDTRGGKLYESAFGARMRGRGEIAEQIRQTFALFVRKHGLDCKLPPLDASRFRKPVPSSGQGWLFPDWS